MYPLFGGIPGGPELLVLLLMLVFMVVPIAVGSGLFLFGRWTAGSGDGGDGGGDDGGDDRIAELQARVEELERQLATERDGTGDDDGDA